MIDKRLFHELWTKTVGTPGYIKRDWQELERQIDKANQLKEKRGGDR